MKTDKFVHQGLIAKSEVIEKHLRRRNKKLVIVISLLNVGLLVLLWILITTPNTVAQHSSNDPSLVGDVPSPLIGKSAPDFTLPMLNSNNLQMRLSDLKGKPFIVNFWGSTCPPCQQETPFLTQEWSPLQAKGITLVGIHEEDTESNARAFIQRYGITYPNVQDTLMGQTSIAYGVAGQPTTFFVSSKGIIVAKWLGPLNAQGLKGELAKMYISLD